jgi:hypothetical protein
MLSFIILLEDNGSRSDALFQQLLNAGSAAVFTPILQETGIQLMELMPYMLILPVTPIRPLE